MTPHYTVYICGLSTLTFTKGNTNTELSQDDIDATAIATRDDAMAATKKDAFEIMGCETWGVIELSLIGFKILIYEI